MRGYSLLGLLLLVPILAGCGSAQAKVSGQVLYNDAPLPGGRLTFLPVNPEQNAVSAEIDEQGNYQVVLPVGDVQIIVDNRELEPSGPPSAGLPQLPPDIKPDAMRVLGNAQKSQSRSVPAENAPERPPGKYVQIPRRYYDVETSDLIFTVQSGSQTHNIELRK
ncbi:MAG: hypothetical protein E6K70_08195 [Planctomycetota bacterium]|nr:MAG: hypothetical protein E6K70_08195 [Planctomycetota bacterium]